MKALKKTNEVEIVVENGKAAASQLPVGPDSIPQSVREYRQFKEEIDRISKIIARLHRFLETELGKLPGQEIEVDGRTFYLCPCVKESFDWESAKEKLLKGELAKLMPFVETVEVFDWKAAKNHTDEKLLEKMEDLELIEKKTSNQLRDSKKKEDKE